MYIRFFFLNRKLFIYIITTTMTTDHVVCMLTIPLPWIISEKLTRHFIKSVLLKYIIISTLDAAPISKLIELSTNRQIKQHLYIYSDGAFISVLNQTVPDMLTTLSKNDSLFLIWTFRGGAHSKCYFNRF